MTRRKSYVASPAPVHVALARPRLERARRADASRRWLPAAWSGFDSAGARRPGRARGSARTELSPALIACSTRTSLELGGRQHLDELRTCGDEPPHFGS